MRINKSKLYALMRVRNYTIDNLARAVGQTPPKFKENISIGALSKDIYEKICDLLVCGKDELLVENKLLSTLRNEKEECIEFGIYESTQILFASIDFSNEKYGLNYQHIKHIYETNNIATLPITTTIDTLIELKNHFKCVDYILDTAEVELTENYIKHLHEILLESSYSGDNIIGEYKLYDQTKTPIQDDLNGRMNELITNYNNLEYKNLTAIITLIYYFREISPFDRKNKTVSQLIALKECLKHNIIPFYVDENIENKGIQILEKDALDNFKVNVCLPAQTQYAKLLKQYKI